MEVSQIARTLARHLGLNEDLSAGEKRTGYSKFKVTIDGGSVDGPTGDVTKESINTFGLSADKFLLVTSFMVERVFHRGDGFLLDLGI